MELTTDLVDVDTTATNWTRDSLQNDFDESNSQNVYVFIIDIILLVTNLSALAANIVIVYIILKSKLWKVTNYVFILNWVILDMFHLLTSPAILKWYEKLGEIYPEFVIRVRYFNLSIVFQLGLILLLFVFILKKHVAVFEKHYWKIICFIWSVVLVIGVLTVLCMGDFILHLINAYLLFAMCAICLIANFVICVVLLCKKEYLNDRDSALILTLATTYVSYWLLFVLLVIFIVVMQAGEVLLLWIQILCVFYAFAETNSLINVYILAKLEKRFQAKLERLLFWRKPKNDCEISLKYERHTAEA